MIYGYARVSSVKQQRKGNSLEEQCKWLTDYGCSEIIEEQYTGKTTTRPKFTALIEKLQSGDTLVVTKLDRFARTTIEGIETIQGLVGRGVRVYIGNMGLVENTPNGRLILTIMLAFAEYEREQIIERTEAGKQLLREQGLLKEGRPKKDLDVDKIALFYGAQKTGEMTVEQICSELNISKSTWYNRLKELAA